MNSSRKPNYLGLLSYSLHVVGMSLTRHHHSNTVEMDDYWELFYSGIEPAKFAKAGVDILITCKTLTRKLH